MFDETRQLLEAGIAAARLSQHEEARRLLTQVIEVDPDNELAWLWLADVVETDEDKRLCYENVLEINPQNSSAKQGLLRLGVATTKPLPKFQPMDTFERDEEEEEERPLLDAPVPPPPDERLTASIASAILNPEQASKKQSWRDLKLQDNYLEAAIEAKSHFNDIWDRDNVEMCPYCAQELTPEQNSCPKCKRNLVSYVYRYENPSYKIHVLWVLLIAMVQMYLMLSYYDLLAQRNALPFIWNGIMMVVFSTLAFSVYKRQTWAYILTIIIFFGSFVSGLNRMFVWVDLSPIGGTPAQEIINSYAEPMLNSLGSAIALFQVVIATVGFLFAILTAPDFQKMLERRLATVIRGSRDSREYHDIAVKRADDKMWAEAILHWQRAAANAPNQTMYQRQLGMAYAQLGFYERSLDVLQSAQKRTSNQEKIADLQRIIDAVTEKLRKSQGT